MTAGVATAEVDRATFVRANTGLIAPPHVPEIVLHLADEAMELWQLTEDDLGAIGLPPPYWAFAWAGGQALARHILDHPAIVRGRSVLDLASGSGLVAIAAAKAGAATVVANEIDAYAHAAIRLNAEANGVALTLDPRDLLGEPPGAFDVILAGDVFYEKSMAERILGWLIRAGRAGSTVLVGDPGRSYLPRERLEKLATYAVPVTRALEDSEIKQTSVWRLPA